MSRACCEADAAAAAAAVETLGDDADADGPGPRPLVDALWAPLRALLARATADDDDDPLGTRDYAPA